MRSHLILNDRKKCFSPGIWNDKRVNISIPFQKPKDWDLTCGTTAAFALTPATKIAFIDFDLAAHQRRFITDNLIVDGLAKLMKEEDCRIAIDAG